MDVSNDQHESHTLKTQLVKNCAKHEQEPEWDMMSDHGSKLHFFAFALLSDFVQCGVLPKNNS